MMRMKDSEMTLKCKNEEYPSSKKFFLQIGMFSIIIIKKLINKLITAIKEIHHVKSCKIAKSQITFDAGERTAQTETIPLFVVISYIDFRYKK